MSIDKTESLDDLMTRANNLLNETGDIEAFKNTLSELEKTHSLDPEMSRAILNAAEARRGYYAAVKEIFNMGNWKYYQLIATFYGAFFDLVGQGVTYGDAINRVFNDFWFFPEENNKLVNLISLTQYIEVKFSMDNKINNDLVVLFNSQIEKMNSINLEENLTLEEIEHLTETIDEINYKIDKMNSL